MLVFALIHFERERLVLWGCVFLKDVVIYLHYHIPLYRYSKVFELPLFKTLNIKFDGRLSWQTF